MNHFFPFEMERLMSQHEQDVQFNLSESGVHPITLRQLIAGQAGLLDELLDTAIQYPHANGIPLLRQRIADTYDGASAENVLVTVGGIEANYLAVRTILQPGEEIMLMMPNYMQVWGIARNHDLNLKTFKLLPADGWAPDLDELQSKLSSATKMIAVCHPNNPTGRALTEDEMHRIIELASQNDSWLLSDEVYRGAERQSESITPSFFGRYDRVIAIGSMSKAYGLPGLRIGWICGQKELIPSMWARHEYLTIAASMLSNQLAAVALQPDRRQQLLHRSRDYIRNGHAVLRNWIDKHQDLFSWTPPDAGAVAFVKYHHRINSSELVQRLIQEKNVLVVPGDHFGMDHYLRISLGLPPDVLSAGLDRIAQLFEAIRQARFPV